MTALGGRVLSVQVGRARSLAIGDLQVLSGIRKHSVAGRIAVRPLGLEGDEQADLTVHGGLAKAVYAYPVEHYEFWQGRRLAWGLPGDLQHGALGENLTIAGVLERDLYVGDQLSFPDCLLRVTQPREPCYKFNAVMASDDAARSMARSAYSGFYLAVERAGSISAGEQFTVIGGERSLPLMTLFRSGRRRSP
jgi:MOSC domain-containing protein YiiM